MRRKFRNRQIQACSVFRYYIYMQFLMMPSRLTNYALTSVLSQSPAWVAVSAVVCSPMRGRGSISLESSNSFTPLVQCRVGGNWRYGMLKSLNSRQRSSWQDLNGGKTAILRCHTECVTKSSWNKLDCRLHLWYLEWTRPVTLTVYTVYTICVDWCSDVGEDCMMQDWHTPRTCIDCYSLQM